MTIELVRKTDGIYELLALCCKYIIEKIELEYYELHSFDDENYKYIYDMIESYTSEIEDIGHKKAYAELKNSVCNWLQTGITLERCYAIVRYIDELVELEMRSIVKRIPGFFEYSTLNRTYQDEIRIIPKIKDMFLKDDEGEFLLKDPNNVEYPLFREESECFASVVDEVTNNYMIWDKRNVERFPIRIMRIDDNSSLADHFYHKNKLTIGIVPFTRKKLNKVLNMKFGKGTFHVDDMRKDANEELKERYKDIYLRSQDKDVDFLIYPEMLMSEDIIDSLPNEGLSEKGPKFIINGSVWTNYSNRTITTDLFGNRVFTYYKKCAFKYKENEKKYKEVLNSDINKEFVVLEIPGFGRIAICICKDLADENILLFHKMINTNVLFVPAFSNSFQLKNDAKTMASKYNCITVFANSCSAYCEHWKKDSNYDIGFVTIPAKLKTSSDYYMQDYTAEKCHLSCGMGCSCKLFTISFNEIVKYDDRFSIRINHMDF